MEVTRAARPELVGVGRRLAEGYNLGAMGDIGLAVH